MKKYKIIKKEKGVLKLDGPAKGFLMSNNTEDEEELKSRLSVGQQHTIAELLGLELQQQQQQTFKRASTSKEVDDAAERERIKQAGAKFNELMGKYRTVDGGHQQALDMVNGIIDNIKKLLKEPAEQAKQLPSELQEKEHKITERLAYLSKKMESQEADEHSQIAAREAKLEHEKLSEYFAQAKDPSIKLEVLPKEADEMVIQYKTTLNSLDESRKNAHIIKKNSGNMQKIGGLMTTSRGSLRALATAVHKKMRSISTELSKLTTVDGNRELTTEEVNEIITAINEKEVWKIDLKRQERRQEKTEIDKFKDSLKKNLTRKKL